MRTYVPQGQRFDAHAAHARGASALPLVPHARGRRRRRLGGRLDRACGARRAPSPSSAARAEAAEAGAAPARRVVAGRARLPLAHPRPPRARACRSHAASAVAAGSCSAEEPTCLPRSTTTSRAARKGGSRPLRLNRRRPTLPGPCEPSTIGAEGLNFSVRNGKRCFPLAKATGKGRERASPGPSKLHSGLIHQRDEEKHIRQALDLLVPVC